MWHLHFQHKGISGVTGNDVMMQQGSHLTGCLPSIKIPLKALPISLKTTGTWSGVVGDPMEMFGPCSWCAGTMKMLRCTAGCIALHVCSLAETTCMQECRQLHV